MVVWGGVGPGGGGTKPEKEVLSIGCHSASKQPTSGLRTNEASAGQLRREGC